MASFLLSRRPTVRVELIALLVLAYLVSSLNGPWWSAILASRAATSPATWAFAAAVFAALVALHFLAVALLATRWTVKPLLAVLAIASAAASYYMRAYATVLDPTMVQNFLHTDLHEARELISARMLISVLAGSALPLLFLMSVRVRAQPWPSALTFRLGCVAGAVVIAALMLLSVSRDLTPLMRSQPNARYLVTPGNLVNGLVKNAIGSARDASGPRLPVGLDARVRRPIALVAKPRVLVFVLGETARAANFSLLGYHRNTNPELAKLDVTAFQNVTSCGTSTEVSVPCLFSIYGRENYDEHLIRRSEGLLDVVARAGYAVKWRDNQSGCKGVCGGAGIDYRKLDAAYAPDLCDGADCLDEVLLRSLVRDLDDVTGDTVIVLHMIGNHGPAYHKRYPRRFATFRPDCATAELRRCTREEIVNAYDNGIRYTDYVIAGVVRALQARATTLQTAMIYVSDHGESLGEGGLYLHGIPRALAPDTQVHVPLIAWLSPGLAKLQSVDLQCLQNSRRAPLSHDWLFHSILGLLDIETSIYRPARDFLRACRRPTTLLATNEATAAAPGARSPQR